MSLRVSARLGRVAPLSVGRFGAAVLGLLVIAAVVAPTIGPDYAAAIATVAILIGAGTAGATLLSKAALAPPEERPAWRTLGAGLLTISGGMVVFGVTHLGSYAAAFGPPDLLFLAGYVIGMVGIAMLPHTTGNGLQRLRLLLDGIIGAIALIALSWVFIYRQVAAALTDSPTWERVVGTAYPIFDIMMLVTVMIVLVRRSSYRFDVRLILVVIGSVTLAAADMTFLVTGAGQRFIDAEPIYSLHILGVAAFVALATVVHRQPEAREYADRPATPLWAIALPYGTALVMVGVLVFRVQWDSIASSDSTLSVATVLVGVLVLVRQSVSIRENRRFVDQQRTDLVASISHELRTPLTSVVGFLDLLDGEALNDSEERQEITTIANQQAQYLGRIVADLVMLASGTITTMDLQITATPVDTLAWSSVNAAAIDAGQVRVDADRNVTAFLDEGRMAQAIANLLTNAVRYGGEKINVIARQHAGDLTIEVHDDGPGVPRKYELVIWEKFERGPNRLNAVVPGSGIGLAVTNAIAQAHGGTAGYRRSERLGGACFWIRLPGRAHANTPDVKDRMLQLSVVEDDTKTA